jgi:hypothetical protein
MLVYPSSFLFRLGASAFGRYIGSRFFAFAGYQFREYGRLCL